MMVPLDTICVALPEPDPQRCAGIHLSGLDLLDEEHMATFRTALERLLGLEVSQSTYAEIVDGLPTLDSLNKYPPWARQDHPVVELGHKELCAGSLEKARRLLSEFDVYTLRLPTQSIRDFQESRLGTKHHTLAVVELLARSIHEIAVLIFQRDDGIHKHALYEAWRDAPGPLEHEPKRPGCAFSTGIYRFHEQYPNGIADVAGYWAESKIFGGVVIFNRGPSGTERRAMYLHGTSTKSPFTLFPPTGDQFEALTMFLLSPPRDHDGQDASSNSPGPLPITASALNGWRYHPDDAISRFNIFRDRYERIEPPARRRHHRLNQADVWPEHGYELTLLLLTYDRSEGRPVDEAKIAEAKAGLMRITPSSPMWRLRRDST